ncbi:MAG: hypothetical protein IT258_22595 [Saprospiraceae bacterium]|nr:hypothetical protein [Saprospiraceae bacterium]
MNEINLLDGPTTEGNDKKPATLPQKIVGAIEFGLWLVFIASFFIQIGSYGDNAFSNIGNMFAMPQAPIALYAALILFYLCFGVLIFRSQNLKQHLIGFICGVLIALFLSSLLFLMESWPIGQDLLLVACIGNILAFAAAYQPSKTTKDKALLAFLKNIYSRTGIIALASLYLTAQIL